MRKRIHWDSRAGLLAVVVTVFIVEVTILVVAWDPNDWKPLALVLVLALACALGEMWPIEVRGVQTSTGGFLRVLPMVLLGPAPASPMALANVAVDTARRRPATLDVAVNIVQYLAMALVGSLVFAAVDSAAGGLTPTALALWTFAFAIGIDLFSFGVMVINKRFLLGSWVPALLRGTFGPIAASHVVLSTLVAAAAYAYVEVGLGALVAFLVVLRASEVLLRAVASADARASEIETFADERALFLTQSLVAEEAEREWLANHLHDEALQLLAVAAQDLDEALEGDRAALERGRQHVLVAVDEMRRTLTHFHPIAIAADGLRPALETLTRQLCRRSQGVVEVPNGLEVEDASLVYAVAREVIANSAKHANAQHISVRLLADDGRLVLTVADDGVGFTPTDVPEGHLGLLLTKHRVSAAGGNLTLRSSLGAGTVAVASLPAR